MKQPIRDNPSVQLPYEYDDDVSLPDFVGILYRGWRLIAVITFLSVAAMALAAYLMTPIYQARVLLAPAVDEQSGSLSKLAGSFGDIANVAGLNLGGGSGNSDEAIALLKSRMLAEQFIRDENLLPVLFAKKWDTNRGDWVVEDSEDIPTMGDAFRLWDEDIRKVESTTTSVLVTLTINWKDRELAAKWAAELVRRVNELMRSRAIAEAQKIIGYLDAELAKTSVVEVRQAIYRMTESQINTVTLAKARDEYFFKVIDPSVVPDADDFVEPRRLLMIIIGLFGGAMLGLMAVIFINAMRPVERAATD